jgi:hypothetical protein
VQQGGGGGVDLPECHWPGRGYSAICKSRAITCERCRRDYQSIETDACEICRPENLCPVSFSFKLPALTLELIKAKHGNVSQYLRELIARDMGEDVFPAQPRRNPGGETSDLKSLAEIGKPITKKRSKQKHANGSTNHRKVGRILAPKRNTPED